MSFNSNPLLAKSHAYAKRQHAGQTRKGARGDAYLHHVVEVAEIIQKVVGKEDTNLIAAAFLHDVLEDSDATYESLVALFNDDIAHLVMELSDENGLDEATRRQAQIDHAPHLSSRAKLVKIADKISNLEEMRQDPPPSWSPESQRSYLAWGEAVFAGARGGNDALDRLFRTAAGNLRSRLQSHDSTA